MGKMVIALFRPKPGKYAELMGCPMFPGFELVQD